MVKMGSEAMVTRNLVLVFGPVRQNHVNRIRTNMLLQATRFSGPGAALVCWAVVGVIIIRDDNTMRMRSLYSLGIMDFYLPKITRAKKIYKRSLQAKVLYYV